MYITFSDIHTRSDLYKRSVTDLVQRKEIMQVLEATLGYVVLCIFTIFSCHAIYFSQYILFQ